MNTIEEAFQQRINSMSFSGNYAAVEMLRDLKEEVLKEVSIYRDVVHHYREGNKHADSSEYVAASVHYEECERLMEMLP